MVNRYMGSAKSEIIQLKSKLIFYYFLKYSGSQSGQLVIDEDFLETILELDSIVIRQLMLAMEGVVFEYEELPDLGEYKPQMLMLLNSTGLQPLKVNAELIESVLHAADLAVFDSISV